jgi:sulfatase modifying factor 1
MRTKLWRKLLVLLPSLFFIVLLCKKNEKVENENMVLIEGGIFQMGDIFDEGNENEKPIHKVKVSDFYMSKYEVTVGEFRDFTIATGYKTSAEDRKFKTGAACWNTEKLVWEHKDDASWQKPYTEQTERNPVVCVSWYDALNYLNWISESNSIPKAYDFTTGKVLLIDENGKHTEDIQRVRGYRLPTEAEWEYAARAGGKKKRFGNGSNNAKSNEINYNARRGKNNYSNQGIFRKQTMPVGSYAPNDLGLYDMSGNVWEWVYDSIGQYPSYSEVTINPYNSTEKGRITKGGRWGGPADELRVSCRISWHPASRCNNAGFRIVKSR